ncbi:MAG TPA: methyltransferase domain-containing protein [Rhizobiaceae bacterium]|nr:methyltransferase domain-containing protein [Rhizobiaceae bacterium]
MRRVQLSSGDLLADRRADYAEMCFAEGDYPAAADLMRDAVLLVPLWVAGQFRLGEMLEAAGRIAEAVEAWHIAIRLDPEDRLGASLKLALCGAIALAPPPAHFVEMLFDQYAEDFEEALVDRLDYRVPEFIDAALKRAGRSSFSRVADLGCGTGLMGERLRDRTGVLEGYDISAEMLKRAEAKGIYDRLEKDDLNDFRPGEDACDLVTAADVFMYLGPIDGIVATARAMLQRPGFFAFSVERHDGPEDFILRPSRRYAHSRSYLERILGSAGFRIEIMEEAVIRRDRGQPVAGLIVVAKAD